MVSSTVVTSTRGVVPSCALAQDAIAATATSTVAVPQSHVQAPHVGDRTISDDGRSGGGRSTLREGGDELHQARQTVTSGYHRVGACRRGVVGGPDAAGEHR